MSACEHCGAEEAETEAEVCDPADTSNTTTEHRWRVRFPDGVGNVGAWSKWFRTPVQRGLGKSEVEIEIRDVTAWRETK